MTQSAPAVTGDNTHTRLKKIKVEKKTFRTHASVTLYPVEDKKCPFLYYVFVLILSENNTIKVIKSPHVYKKQLDNFSQSAKASEAPLCNPVGT